MTNYDFFSPATRDEPYPLLNRLREHDPVYETAFGYWYVSRYDDASSLLRDPRLVAGRGVPDSLGITEGPLRRVMDSWMMAIDGPEHARTRRLISRAFTPRGVDALRPRIDATTAGLVNAFMARGGGDLLTALAFPLPMEVVRVLFGVDPETWDREVVALFDDRARAGTGVVNQMGALVRFFEALVPQRRENLGDDTFSALFGADEDGDVLTDGELVANAVLIVTAGFETTMSLIALSVLALLQHPDQLAVLRRDWSLVRSAVDEVLRFDPAAQSTTRSTTVDVEVQGVVIPAGANVLFSIGAANRDPRRYPDPDRFDVTRTDIRPLTFGGGVHSCIGAALARLETEIAVTALFQTAATLRLAPGGIEWQAANPTVRRPVRLVLEV